MIQVKIFYAKNDLRNFNYLIFDKQSGDSWIIDPFDEKPIIDYIKKESLTLKGILNTHDHWDHTRGNSALQDYFKCQVLSNSSNQLKLDASHQLSFVPTPGHTAEHTAFFWQKGESVLALFSGDTLFNSGVGNCKHGGNVEQLYDTTTHLKSLSDEVILYPGHDYVLNNLLFAKTCEPENKEIDEALKLVKNSDTEKGIAWTLGQEKKVNPFLRLDSAEIQHQILKDPNNSDQKKLFIQLRSLRDNW